MGLLMEPHTVRQKREMYNKDQPGDTEREEKNKPTKKALTNQTDCCRLLRNHIGKLLNLAPSNTSNPKITIPGNFGKMSGENSQFV